MRFSNDKVSFISIYFCAWNISVWTDCLSEDVKSSVQTEMQSSIILRAVNCLGQICFLIFFSVSLHKNCFALWKTPLITKHFVCVGGLNKP